MITFGVDDAAMEMAEAGFRPRAIVVGNPLKGLRSVQQALSSVSG